jgi:hypothetical protein
MPSVCAQLTNTQLIPCLTPPLPGKTDEHIERARGEREEHTYK